VRFALLAALGIVATGAKDSPDDLPLFVVERSRVIWPQRCARSESRLPSHVESRLRTELGERGIFVGAGRVEEVGFGPTECLSGECGGGQVAVPLAVSESERHGIVLPPGRVPVSAIHPLVLVGIEGGDPDGLRPGLKTPPEPPPPCGEPPPDGPARSPASGRLITCLSYAEASGALGVQVQGRGELQGNGYARYELVRFRLVERRELRRVEGPWHDQPRGRGSHLPVPVAVLPAARPPEVRLVWLRREGICCPSAASAWMTDVGEHAREGPRHVAGFGQACD
jgi:hypothetical protein